MSAKIYIGTSGWSYGDWTDGVFYPPDINNKEWLKYYSEHFNTVEVNASFYHQMSPKVYANWRQSTPSGFIFSVKMSRYLTHIKKLNEPKESWERFIAGAGELKEKLGPILFQLPPNFKADVKKLENLLKVIRDNCHGVLRTPRGRAQNDLRVTFEFRDESWFCKEVYDILKKYNTALVFAGSIKWPSPLKSPQPPLSRGRDKRNSVSKGKPSFNGEIITADFIYIRMHGPGSMYDSKYTDKQLKKWAERIKKWSGKVENIYIYFNNDFKGYAVENAKILKELLK